jgi:hypothetical protein
MRGEQQRESGAEQTCRGQPPSPAHPHPVNGTAA